MALHAIYQARTRHASKQLVHPGVSTSNTLRFVRRTPTFWAQAARSTVIHGGSYPDRKSWSRLARSRRR
ncbi:hypothetical protein MCOR34_009876 [Pyricularia oryzae]|nr:hypothetical protein MCOR34_009876 [Pyricularia oryzae]